MQTIKTGRSARTMIVALKAHRNPFSDHETSTFAA
jgi:hypothetical protein